MSTGTHSSREKSIKTFISALVDMTNGPSDINKRSLIKPGVTIKQEANRLLKLLNRESASRLDERNVATPDLVRGRV